MKQKTIKTILLFVINTVLGFLLIVSFARAERTVIDSERGFNSYAPFNNEWSKIGAYFGFGFGSFSSLRDEAIKLAHGRFQHFLPADDGAIARFPFYKFTAYNEDEKDMGSDSMFVSANYGGKDRQIYYTSYSSQCPLLEGSTCNLSDAELRSVVNFSDDRYVKFYVNEYARKIEHDGGAMNIWNSNDNCGFGYGYYYLLDEDKKVHIWGNNNNTSQYFSWNQPYAQNYDGLVQDIRDFASKVRAYAPDIKLFWNGLGDDARFAQISENVDGHMEEDPLGKYAPNMSDQGWRNWFFSRLNNDQLANSLEKKMYYRADFSNLTGDDYANKLKNYYLAYLIHKGDNYFFSPSKNSQEIDPADYTTIQNNLGKPLEPAQSEKAATWASWSEKRLYSRKFEGGIVYFNITGELDKTINLPAGQIYYNPETGNPITQITVPDLCQTSIYATILSNSPCGTNNTIKSAGAYVVTSPGERAAIPQVFPNTGDGAWSGGEVEVSLESQTLGAEIRYTLDGREPTASSTLYSAPFKITSSKVLKAKSFVSGFLDSFTAEKNFSISGDPAVDFHLSIDSGSEFLDTAHGLAQLAQPSGKEVSVNYAVTGGTAENGKDYNLSSGTLTFRKGEKYKYFPINIINDNLPENNETIELTLSSPKNASLGTKQKFTYTIQDNDLNRSQSLNYLDIPADADTSISLQNPNSNNGTNNILLYVGNALLHFDLSFFPNNAQINSAQLKVYGSVFDDNHDGQVQTSVYRILKEWKENEVTWNKVDVANNWSVPGAKGEDVDRSKGPTDTKNAIDYQTWDLTNDVQKMVSGEYANKGWLLQGPAEGEGSFNFFPRDRANTTYIFKPRLRITYSTSVNLRGDINSDGLINVTDLGILMHDWFKTAAQASNPRSDINSDGAVNVIDLGMMMSEWS